MSNLARAFLLLIEAGEKRMAELAAEKSGQKLPTESDKPKRMGKIYALVDPRNKEVRYVGQTVQELVTRRVGHCVPSNKTNMRLKDWITELKEHKLKPDIITLEDVEEDKLNERERFWIDRYYHLDLLNKSNNPPNKAINRTETPSLFTLD